jgi:hypothetical protein
MKFPIFSRDICGDLERSKLKFWNVVHSNPANRLPVGRRNIWPIMVNFEW